MNVSRRFFLKAVVASAAGALIPNGVAQALVEISEIPAAQQLPSAAVVALRISAPEAGEYTFSCFAKVPDVGGWTRISKHVEIENAGDMFEVYFEDLGAERSVEIRGLQLEQLVKTNYINTGKAAIGKPATNSLMYSEDVGRNVIPNNVSVEAVDGGFLGLPGAILRRES